MVHTIKIIDSGADRYVVDPRQILLGRQYDDKADTIVVEVPESEKDNLCIMIITDIKGVPVDSIVLKDLQYTIRNNVSQNRYVKIGFRFINQDGYNKGSEILVGQFLSAQCPENFAPTDPEQKANLEYVYKYGFTDSVLVGNELQFFNANGEMVVAFDLSPFTQEQSDWAEQDSGKETYIKNKPTTTSAFENNGADGSSPYATEEFVRNYTPQIEVDAEISDTSENPVQNKTIKKYVDGEIAQIETEISTIPKFAVKVVSSLPTTDISTTTIYLVPSEKYETENYYDEYIYVDGKWELIGTTKVDLTDYARIDEENTFVAPNTFNGETIFNGVSEHNADVKVNNSVFKVLDNTVEENGTQRDLVTSYSADDIVRETGDGETKQTYTYTYPEKSGTLALTTDVPDVNVDNSTISKNDQNQLQAIGLTDGTNINTFEEIDEAITIERL